MDPLHCAAGVLKPALAAAAGLGRWFVDVAVLLNAGVFQLCVEALLGNHSAQNPASV